MLWKKMEKLLKKYLIDIEKAARFFNQNFVDKQVIYSTKSSSITVVFKKSNFMHLCGIIYKDGAEEFFNACLANKLDLNKITIKKETRLKLAVLNSIELLLSPNITLASNAKYFQLSFDKALKTKKQVFALALTTKNNNSYFPLSLLNLKSMRDFPNGESITSIKVIDLETKEDVYIMNYSER